MFAGNDIDWLAGCMQDAYIAPPPYPTDSQVTDDGHFIGPGDVRFAGSCQSSTQYVPSPSYTASSTPWVQGYVAGPNEDVNYIRGNYSESSDWVA